MTFPILASQNVLRYMYIRPYNWNGLGAPSGNGPSNVWRGSRSVHGFEFSPCQVVELVAIIKSITNHVALVKVVHDFYA